MTIDLHLDTPWRMTKHWPFPLRKGAPHSQFSLDKARAGGLDVPVFALYLSDKLQDSLGKELTRARLEQQISLFQGYILGLEGGRLIDNNLKYLEYLREKGVRYLTLTHNRNTDWAGSATDFEIGLAPFGQAVVKRCEDLGILVDVSHASDSTIEDVLSIATKPVIATHSGSRTVKNHPRNLPDDLAKELGLIGVPFARKFTGPTAEDFWDHIGYLIDLVGADKLAIGSDLDGADMIDEVFDVRDWRAIVLDHPRARKFPKSIIDQISGGNALRILNGV